MKRLSQNVALGLASAVIALLVIELAVRLFAPGWFVPNIELDPVLGWRGRPSVRCIFSNHLYHVKMPIAQNARGFRDRDHDMSKPPGVTRILCLGDSFTWGWAVAEDQIYSSVLEQFLRAEGLDAEVVNAGVQGYNTVQSVLYLEQQGFAYSPDVVICQTTRNDVPHNAARSQPGVWQYPYGRLDDAGRPQIEGTPVQGLSAVAWLKYNVARHSRLGYLLKTRLDRWRQLRARQAILRDGAAAERSYQAGKAFRLFSALISRMSDDCAANGVRFVAVLDFELEDREVECLREVCDDVEMLLLNRHIKSLERETGLPAYIPDDGHWTVEGHAWVARAIADSLFGPTAEGGRGEP